MNQSDIIAVLQWWLVIFVLGVGFTPVTFRLFSPFFDKGYLYSRLVGLVLVGFFVFVLGTFHIATFSNPTIIITALIIAAVAFFFFKPLWKLLIIFKQMWYIFILEELLFLGILFMWAYIHSFSPDIHGLEKYMDFGFVNSLLRSDYFPPKDMWFTPYTINYYYFGHLLTALLTKLSGLPSYISFNLMLSTIVAFCFTTTFSLGANLYYFLVKAEKFSKLKLALAGLLTAALTTFAGNLHLLYGFFKPYNTDNPVPMWDLPFKPFNFPNSYWYPNATRFIYHTIHEFPIYSWTVADLHGHVLDIPFVLLTVSLLFSFYIMHSENPDAEKTVGQTFIVHPLHLLFIGVLLAVMYMTNAWDGAIYWALAAMTLAVIHGQKKYQYKAAFDKNESASVVKNGKKQTRFGKLQSWQIAWVRDFSLSILVVTAAFLLFSTPYNIHFKPFASGIGVICAPDVLTKIGKIGPFLFEADHCQRSYWWELATLYGFFYFFVIAFGVFLVRAKRHSPTDVFVALLIILSTLLIFIPEFFYLKDIYPTYYRANTMFKLVFQAFMMLSITSAYVIYRMTILIPYQRLTKKIFLFIFFLVSAMLVCVVLTYPYLAVNAYYNNLKTYQGLDGITYLKNQYPDDYLAIQWLNKNIKGQPVILEAQGDSYTDYARISANTGLPTVLGWTVHEWLWRGTYDIPAPRIEEVKTLYETTNMQTAKDLIQKYNVQYVYIGSLEFQKYPNLNESKFAQLGQLVYNHGTVKIYKINQYH